MMRVIHLTSVHSPLDTRIFYKECRTLKKAGYDVVLIAPHGGDEIREGIKIIGISKPGGRLRRMTLVLWQIYKKAVSENGDIYHFHDPELMPVGLMLKLHGKRVIYDVHEHYPRMIRTKPWIHKIFRVPISLIVNLIEITSALFFDKVIVVVPYIGKRFQQNKVVLVQNYLITEHSENIQLVHYPTRPNSMVYHGSICRERGIEEMIKSLEVVNKRCEVNLLLVGRFDKPELESSIIAMKGWSYVDFRGWMEISETMELIKNARVGLILLHPVPTHVESLPTKLFEYMALGIPVVISNVKMWKEIVDKYNCGITVDPFNLREITDAIIWLLQNPESAEKMGENGRLAVKEYFSWDSEAGRLLEAYSSIANSIPNGH